MIIDDIGIECVLLNLVCWVVLFVLLLIEMFVVCDCFLFVGVI